MVSSQADRHLHPCTVDYKQALELARTTNATLMEAELAEEVSQILEQLGHYQTAAVFFRRGTQLQRRVLAADVEKLIAVIEIRHKIEQDAREKEIYRIRNVQLANALSELQEKTDALKQHTKNSNSSKFSP